MNEYNEELVKRTQTLANTVGRLIDVIMDFLMDDVVEAIVFKVVPITVLLPTVSVLLGPMQARYAGLTGKAIVIVLEIVLFLSVTKTAKSILDYLFDKNSVNSFMVKFSLFLSITSLIVLYVFISELKEADILNYTLPLLSIIGAALYAFGKVGDKFKSIQDELETGDSIQSQLYQLLFQSNISKKKACEELGLSPSRFDKLVDEIGLAKSGRGSVWDVV